MFDNEQKLSIISFYVHPFDTEQSHTQLRLQNYSQLPRVTFNCTVNWFHLAFLTQIPIGIIKLDEQLKKSNYIVITSFKTASCF